MIRSVRMPFFVFAIRIVVRNLLALAHNILVIIVVFALPSSYGPAWHILPDTSRPDPLGGGLCWR